MRHRQTFNKGTHTVAIKKVSNLAFTRSSTFAEESLCNCMVGKNGTRYKDDYVAPDGRNVEHCL